MHQLQIEKLDLLQMLFLYILFPNKNSSYMNIHLNQCQFLSHQEVAG